MLTKPLNGRSLLSGFNTEGYFSVPDSPLFGYEQDAGCMG